MTDSSQDFDYFTPSNITFNNKKGMPQAQKVCASLKRQCLNQQGALTSSGTSSQQLLAWRRASKEGLE